MLKLLLTPLLTWNMVAAPEGGETPSAGQEQQSCNGVLTLDRPDAPRPRSGERLEYELTLAGAYMGRLELSVGELRQVEGNVAVPLLGRIRTNAFVSAVKPVEGRYMAIVDAGSLAPLGVRVEANVGRDPRWEKIRFMDDGRRVETHYL